MSVLEARALQLLPLVRFAARCLVCQTLLDDEAEAEAEAVEPELYWPKRVDLVPSVFLAVPDILSSCIPPVDTDARWDHCGSA